MRGVTVNILKQQVRIDENEWSSRLGLGGKTKFSSPHKASTLENVLLNLGI